MKTKIETTDVMRFVVHKISQLQSILMRKIIMENEKMNATEVDSNGQD